MRSTRSLAAIAATTFAAAACGWFGVQALRAGSAGLGPRAGDYSALLQEAGHPVLMFTTTTCPHCTRARQWMRAQGIDHRVYEIDVSPEARALYARLQARGVPVLVTAGQRITGFQEAGWREALRAELSAPRPSSPPRPPRPAAAP